MNNKVVVGTVQIIQNRIDCRLTCTIQMDGLTPITKLINLSLESGCFPLLWKRALVKPLLKKDGLDPSLRIIDL